MGNTTDRAQGIVKEPEQNFQDFFSTRTREALAMALPLVGAVHAFAAAAYWFSVPYGQALGMSLFSMLVTAAAFCASTLIRRNAKTYIGSDGLATCVLLLALCNALIHLASAWSPLAVAAAVILVVATGAIAARRAPLFVVPVAMQGWWALLAWADNWSAEWVQFEAALLAATATAWGFYQSRRQTAMQLYESQQRLETQAQRDPLTNLPIRPAMIDRLVESFSREKRNTERKFAVCVMNVDSFQAVNEEVGHSGGDLLLQTVAERLRQNARKSDFVARMGGDEFVLLLDETPTREHADTAADRLCGLTCKAIDLDGVEVEFSASFGVAWSGESFESEEAMLTAAHKEMQDAKERFHAMARALEEQEKAQAGAEGAALPSLA